MGLSSTGFTVQTIDEIKTEIENDLKAPTALGANLDVSATSVMGQIIGLFAEREHDLQVLSRDVWTAFTPSGATGESLTELSLITGTIRRDATFSTVAATVNLNAGVTLPAGSRANVAGDETAIFATDEDVTNSGGSPANVAVNMTSVTAGVVRANAGTLTQINTPVSGWNSVTNALDAEVGQEDETDPELRLRRETELRVQGSSNIDAIAADVSTVENVLDVAAFENDGDTTDSDGLPPHSFEIVIWDDGNASDDSVAQAIWNSKPVGILSYGNGESGTAVDSLGADHTVDFSRADERDIYLEFDITTNSNYPVDGDDQIKAAVVAFTEENWHIGDDVIVSALYPAVFSVSGVVSITALRVGFTASPVGVTDLNIDPREIALADTSRIVVNS